MSKKDPNMIMTFKKSELYEAYHFLVGLADEYVLEENSSLRSFIDKVGKTFNEKEQEK